MKLVRLATCAALAGSLLVVGTSHAAAKPVCNLITDPKGDADIQSGQGNDAALDITSVDFGADKKTMTIVIRVDKAATKSAVFPVGAIKLQTNFTVGDVSYFASVVSNSGVAGAFGTVGTGKNTILTTPPAVIDTDKNEARISIPASDFPTPYKSGDLVSAITSRTSSAVAVIATPAVNGSTGGIGIDSATAEVTFKTGTPSCVAIGK